MAHIASIVSWALGGCPPLYPYCLLTHASSIIKAAARQMQGTGACRQLGESFSKKSFARGVTLGLHGANPHKVTQLSLFFRWFKMADSFSKRVQMQDIGLWLCIARATRDKRGGSTATCWGTPDVRAAWLCRIPRAPLESPQNYDACWHRSDF